MLKNRWPGRYGWDDIHSTSYVYSLLHPNSSCLAILENDAMVITGGAFAVDPLSSNDVTAQVTQLANINDGWDIKPELNTPRFAHGCGVVKDGDKERIIIAGGIGPDLVELNSVEVYEVGGLLFPPWIEGE